MVSKLYLFLLGFLAVLLTGCVNLTANNTINNKTYTLSYNEPIASAKATGKTISINLAQANPGYRSYAMAYQQGRYQLAYFAEHRWLAPPATMITPIITQALTNTGAYKAVVNAPIYIGTADYQISIELLKLQQYFMSANASTEQLAIKIVIVDMHTGKPIAAKDFSAEVPAAPDPEAGVAAANQALAQIMPAIIQFVLNVAH